MAPKNAKGKTPKAGLLEDAPPTTPNHADVSATLVEAFAEEIDSSPPIWVAPKVRDK